MREHRIAVMCGGKGTRLGTPIKCLTEICGYPFMDWKLAQLRRQGFTNITLVVGPFFEAYWSRYGTHVGYMTDPQDGPFAAAEHLPQPGWWCNGDTLLNICDHNGYFPKLENPVEDYGPIPDIGVCTNYLIEPANVPGGWLDAGMYWGLPPYEWRIVEVRPHHINTPESFEECARYLTRYGETWKKWMIPCVSG